MLTWESFQTLPHSVIYIASRMYCNSSLEFRLINRQSEVNLEAYRIAWRYTEITHLKHDTTFELGIHEMTKKCL